MSAYITLVTPMTDRQCLLAALADLGFGPQKVEVHEDVTELVGYAGDRRQSRAHVVIRRRFVGTSSNDIGFELTPTGYQAHVSDFDRSRYGADWLSELGGRYEVHHAAKLARLAEEERLRFEEECRKLVEAQRQAVREKARKMGYRVKETREGDTLRLVLVKRVY